MASILLAAAGASIGAGFGGTILGLSGAVIGQAAGSIIGTIIDSRIVASFAPNQISEGARLESLRITSSTEGAVIPNVYGRMKIGGNIFWATDFLEKSTTTTQGGSGKGGGGGEVKTTTYAYSCSFAVGLCEGPISGIGRIWADGKPFDLPNAVWRVYTGTETQLPDPFITAKMGAGNAPAYRGMAYIVFEELPLEKFGNRIPQLSFEVIRPTLADGTAESLIRAVNLIPGAGEFVYATETITRSSSGTTVPENQNSTLSKADLPASLDNLEQVAPNLESVSLVVSWFGTDLVAQIWSVVCIRYPPQIRSEIRHHYKSMLYAPEKVRPQSRSLRQSPLKSLSNSSFWLANPILTPFMIRPFLQQSQRKDSHICEHVGDEVWILGLMRKQAAQRQPDGLPGQAVPRPGPVPWLDVRAGRGRLAHVQGGRTQVRAGRGGQTRVHGGRTQVQVRSGRHPTPRPAPDAARLMYIARTDKTAILPNFWAKQTNMGAGVRAGLF